MSHKALLPDYTWTLQDFSFFSDLVPRCLTVRPYMVELLQSRLLDPTHSISAQ